VLLLHIAAAGLLEALAAACEALAAELGAQVSNPADVPADILQLSLRLLWLWRTLLLVLRPGESFAVAEFQAATPQTSALAVAGAACVSKKKRGYTGVFLRLRRHGHLE
jgi:hypothetical protein